jgi:outer membrane beta-barrel protein
MMKPQYVLALVAAGLLSFGSRAEAQDMSFDLDDAEAEPEPAADDGPVGDVIGDLAAEGDEGLGAGGEQRERAKETVEEIYAIQRIFALRLNRLELAPSVGFNINDPYVSHPALGLALNYWFTNVLAVGANFNWYQGLGNAHEGGSDLNHYVQRSARLGVPVTEWQLGANINFTYVPIYGKFTMFQEFIFQWDMYVVGGVGIMRTRPIPVVDPDFRDFDFANQVAFNAGLGLRIFLTRFLTIFGELRNYMFLEKFESLQVSLTERANPDTWLGGNTLTHNVSIQVGATLFFPFTFEYKKPK